MLRLYSAAFLILFLFLGALSSSGASQKFLNTRLRTRIMAPSSNGVGSQSIAVWYIVNKSADKDYDYLETVFPESLAASIGNISPLVVDTPGFVKDELHKKNISLEKKCSPSDVRETAKKIKADFFIYGEFVPVKKNNVKITLRVYSKKTDTFFTFSETVVIVAEIFPFVDKITSVIINYVSRDGQYIDELIPEGSKLAFVTGLSDAEIHELYLSFLRANYKISFIQNNSVNNKINNKSIMSFFYVTTKNNSYNSALIEENCSSEIPQNCFANEEDDSLRRLYTSMQGNVDYLIIVGFDKRRKSAWVRGIDLKNRNLIWIHPELTGSSIYEISNKMIKYMQTPMPNPFTDKDLGDD